MAVRGLSQHQARLRRLSGPTMEREIGKALFAGADIIRTEAQISITAGSASGKQHVPSAPGQPPNQDTGVLAGNIETELRFDGRGPVAEVSSNAPYSAPLEFGTSKMAARPFMAPAGDAKRAEVRRLVERAVSHLSRR